MKKKIGFIGAGNMAEAMIKGISEEKIISCSQIFISDPKKERLKQLQSAYHVQSFLDNIELVKNSDIVILSIKPQVAKDVLMQIKSVSLKEKIFVSIMAGKKISFISSFLGQKTKIIRVMPNTPALVGQAMSALAKSSSVSQQEFNFTKKIFESVGQVLEIKEDKMDIITAISGSGPAYVYYFAEALIDSAIKQGLSKQEAHLLVMQTVLGAATMMIKIKQDPKILKEKVCSKGGTTLAGLAELKKNNFEKIIHKAVSAAKKRSIELGR